MTHFQNFIETLKATNSAKALALLVMISSPTSAFSGNLPQGFPNDRTITKLAEDASKIPAFVDSDTESKVERFQLSSQSLARDTLLFLNKLRSNPTYVQIYSQDIPATDKLELVKQALVKDFAAFEATTNEQYANLALFNDPEKVAELKSIPGLIRRIDRVSETIEGIREVMMDLQKSTATGPNRADQASVLDNDIQLAATRVTAVLVAVEQRYEEPKQKTSVGEQNRNKPQAQRRDFGI